MPSQKPLKLKPRYWYGWQSFSTNHTGKIAIPTPVYTSAVKPLKTGKGILRIEAIMAVAFPNAKRETIDLKIELHSPAQIVGTYVDGSGVQRIGCLSRMSIDWLTTYCQCFLFKGLTQYPIETEADTLDALSRMFGRSETEILRGATLGRFSSEPRPMPERHETIPILKEVGKLEAYLVRRGVVPEVMEDKWFIYLDGGTLRFHRSWTGFCLYEVDLQDRGDTLYFEKLRVNRDPEQYGSYGTEPSLDEFHYVLGQVLLGKHAAMPPQPSSSGPEFASSWALAGQASLLAL